VIPRASDVYLAVLVPINATSDFATGLRDTWYSALSLLRSDGTELAFVDPSFAVVSPSRYFDTTRIDAIGHSIDLCYYGVNAAGELIDSPLRAGEVVLQVRGPECAAVAPNGPSTPLITRVAYDDPRSPFNGCQRTVTLGATRISNAGGPTATFYSDPYGRATRAGSFVGGVKQYVSQTGNSAAAAIDRVGFGGDTDPCLSGSNIHAPN
jgi:hypothetical protein